MLIRGERSDDIETLFAYELAPIPTALFKNNTIRKGKKSSLASLLKDDVAPADLSELTNIISVMDGDALLHRVYWKTASFTPPSRKL